MRKNRFSQVCLGLVLAGFAATATAAKADDLFVGSQSGLCCFNVDLNQVVS